MVGGGGSVGFLVGSGGAGVFVGCDPPPSDFVGVGVLTGGNVGVSPGGGTGVSIWGGDVGGPVGRGLRLGTGVGGGGVATTGTSVREMFT